MARRLVAAGHSVDIITSDRAQQRRSVRWRKTVEDGIDVHWLAVPYSNHMSYPQRIKAFLHFALQSARKAASVRADVVFATSTPLTIALPAVYAARRQNVPMVFEVRDLWPEIPIAIGALKNPISIALARWLERFAYRNSAEIVALSPGMKDGIVAAGYPANRISVIPNSCDLALFDVPSAMGENFRRKFSWLQDRPLVVYTGTLGLINGVSYLVYVAKEFLKYNPEVRFLIAGEGREEEKVRSLARESGVLNQNLFMIGPLAKEEIPALLSAADVATSLVIDVPVLWANSANKFFDSLAAGTPIAINYAGWQASLLECSGAGLVLPRSVEDAALSLNSFLSDTLQLQRAAAAARQLAVDKFDRDKMAQQLEAILLRVVNGA